MNKTGILIQARLSSSRFPGKMLEDICDFKLCEYVYKRCKTSKIADFVAIITSDEASDSELATFCKSRDIHIFRGSLNNVLDRYIKAAEFFGIENIIRVCGDSPFVDVDLIDEIIQLGLSDKLDYCAVDNCLNGFMSEFVKLSILEQVSQKDDLSSADVEHVSKYVRDRTHEFKSQFVDVDLRPKGLERYTLTVDYPSDIELARKIAMNLKDFNFKSADIIEVLQKLEG